MLQVTNAPQALPAACLFCPGSARELYIDTGLQFDYYGAVYICAECVVSMAVLIGCANPDQTRRFQVRFEELVSEKYELLKRVAGLEAAVHGLADAGLIAIPQRSDFGVLPLDVEGQGTVSAGDQSDASGTGDNLGGGTGASNQPSDDSDVAGLHADDDPDGGFKLNL